MDFRIDPYQADYILTTDGQLDLTDTIDTAVFLCLVPEEGSWWADPSLGSKLHLLKRTKHLDRVLDDASDWAKKALQVLITLGMAKSVSVQSQWYSENPDWLQLTIDVYARQTEPRRYEYFVKVR